MPPSWLLLGRCQRAAVLGFPFLLPNHVKMRRAHFRFMRPTYGLPTALPHVMAAANLSIAFSYF